MRKTQENSRKSYILPAFIAVFIENQGKIQEFSKNERNPKNQGKSGIYAKTSKIRENPKNRPIFNLQ